MELKIFTFNPIQVNSYLLWDHTGEAALIDCGCLFDSEKEALKTFILDKNLQLKIYLNTHLHFDHIFGSPFIAQEFGVSAWASDGDIHWAQSIAERVARFGLSYKEKIPPLGRILSDGDTIKFGQEQIVAIAVPGHSPGSLAYYMPAHKILFSGDALFCGSIGRTDFPDSCHEALITNLREKILTLPPETIVYPGHDRSTTIEYEKEYNFYIR